MSKQSVILIVFLACILGGCTTYSTPRYSTSPANTLMLKSISGKLVNIGKFTSTMPNQNEAECFYIGPVAWVQGADGEPFSEYLRKALLEELRNASLFSTSASTTLRGNLDSIDVSISGGVWSIGLTVQSSNGRSISITEKYIFPSGIGTFACGQAAQSFLPAVQDLIGKLVRSQEFVDLLR